MQLADWEMCVCVQETESESSLEDGGRQREMSQQLLQCSGSQRNNTVFLMHLVLPELPASHMHVNTHFHTYFPAHKSLCFLILLPLMKKRCQGGRRTGYVCGSNLSVKV